MTRTQNSSSGSKRSKPTTDLKWLAHLALKNLSVRKNQPGQPAPKRKGTSKKVETPNFRQLTQKRRRMVEEFMTGFKANPAGIGKYGSDAWISALIRHLNDTRFGIIPLDVHNWLVNESCFNKHNQTYDFDPCNCSNIVIASSGDSSSDTDLNGQRIGVKTEPENGADEDPRTIREIEEDSDGATVGDMMPNGTAAEGMQIVLLPVELWEFEHGRRYQQVGIAEDQDKSYETPASLAGQADTGNTTDKAATKDSVATSSFQEYIDSNFNFISDLRLQSGQDNRLNFTLDCCYNLMSLVQRVLDHAAKQE